MFVKSQATYQPVDTANNYNYRKGLASHYELEKKNLISSIKTSSSAKKKIYTQLYNNIYDNLIHNINAGEIYYYPKLEDYIKGIVTEFSTSQNLPINVKVLISREETKNAYMMLNGTLVFNQNLLSILENENQLAAVVAHEIGHNLLNHSKNKVEKYVEISTDEDLVSEAKQIRRQQYNKNTEAEALLKNLVYNRQKNKREDEIEADKKSFDLLKNSKYSTNQIIRVLEILADSDIEKDSLTTDDFKKFFTLPNEAFNEKLLVGEASSEYLSLDEIFFKWDVDSLKTHPSCQERIVLVKKFDSNNLPTFEKKHNLFSELKSASELENINNNFLQKKYGRSLYSTLKFLKKNPENSFAKKMFTENLKQLKLARDTKNYGKYIIYPNPKEHSKSEQLFYTFFDNLSNTNFDKILTYYSSKP